MEPLSIALSVLSMASTIKDILEMATELYQTLQGVSINMQNARDLAKNMVSTLGQMNKFYEEHSDVLDKSESMRIALDHLQKELTSVYNKCSSFLPGTSTKKIVKVKVAFKSWLMRKEIQADIKELNDRVNVCYLQFITFGVARLEGSTLRIQASTSRIEDNTLRIERHLGYSSEIHGTRFNATGNSLIYPHQFTGTSLYNECVPDAYLRMQVVALHQMLKVNERHPWRLHAERKPLADHFPDHPSESFRPIMYFKPSPSDRPNFHRQVVRKVLEVIQIFEREPDSRLSIHRRISEVVNLGIDLYYLDFYQEATAVGLWAAEFFRKMMISDRQTYQPYFALTLHNLALFHLRANDVDLAALVMAECVNCSRTLAGSSQDLCYILTQSLITSAIIATARGGYTQALESSEEAVMLSRRILSEASVSSLGLPDAANLQLNYVDFDQASNDGAGYEGGNPPSLYLRSLKANFALGHQDTTRVACNFVILHAQALHQLSCNLHRCGRLIEAVEADQRSMETFDLATHLQPEARLEANIADVLYHLTHHDFHLFISYTDALSYSQTSTQLYRKLSANSSIVHKKSLQLALQSRAAIFRGMGRHDEELESWREVIDIARSIDPASFSLADALTGCCGALRQLELIDESIATRREAISVYRSAIGMPSVYEARAYHELAIEFRLADRNLEALSAAQEAVSQYKAPSLANKNDTHSELAASLTLLASILLILQEHDRALETSREAITLFQPLVSPAMSHPFVLDYVYLLDLSMSLAFKWDNEEVAVGWSLEIIGYFTALERCLGPEAVHWALADALRDHALLLNQLNRMPEANEAIETAFQWHSLHWKSHGVVGTERYANCLIDYACMLDTQGLRQEALNSLAQASDITKEYRDDHHHSLASVYVEAGFRQADVLCGLGRFAEALEVARETSSCARAQPSFHNTKTLADCILAHAIAMKYAGEMDAAISAAEEALQICRTKAFGENYREQKAVTELLILQTLVDALGLADRRKESLAYALAALEISSALAPQAPPSRWCYTEDIRITALSYLSIHLVDDGCVERSLDLLLQARSFFAKFAPVRKVLYIDLARVLYLLQILYSVGSHEEESASVAEDLTSLCSTLQATSPDLARLVTDHLELERQKLIRLSPLLDVYPSV